jgi:hypothetical protein
MAFYGSKNLILKRFAWVFCGKTHGFRSELKGFIEREPGERAALGVKSSFHKLNPPEMEANNYNLKKLSVLVRCLGRSLGIYCSSAQDPKISNL